MECQQGFHHCSPDIPQKTQGICFLGKTDPQKIGAKSSRGVFFFKKMEGEQLITSDCIFLGDHKAEGLMV